jgi:hypothetical protein
MFLRNLKHIFRVVAAMSSSSPLPESLMCAVCHEAVLEPVVLSCPHALCVECVERLFGGGDGTTTAIECPTCRAKAAHGDIYRGSKRPAVNAFARDAVVVALGSERYEQLKRARVDEAARAEREHRAQALEIVMSALRAEAPYGLLSTKLAQLTGRDDIEFVLLGAVMSDTIGCQRRWHEVGHMHDVHIEDQLRHSIANCATTIYYLPEHFEYLATCLIALGGESSSVRIFPVIDEALRRTAALTDVASRERSLRVCLELVTLFGNRFWVASSRAGVEMLKTALASDDDAPKV